MLRTLLASSFLLTAFLASGCDGADVDDETPVAPQSVAGVWEGTLVHSSDQVTDGQLTLTLTQVDRAITGQASWRYGVPTGVPGRLQSVGRSGSVLGTVPASGPITYTISFTDEPRQLHEMTLGGTTLSGTWVADGRTSISGTSTLTKR